MIDLILIGVFLGTFALGFKAGNKYKSFKDMLQAGIDAIGSK